MSPPPDTARAEIAHLLGRAGFGARAAEVDVRAVYRTLLAGVLDTDPDAVVADPGSALSFL